MPTPDGGAPGLKSESANRIWRKRVREFSDRVAFRYRQNDTWRTLTWLEADRAIREIAAGFCAIGIGRGDRMALLCQTRLEWVLCDVAMAMVGVVSVPIYPSTTAEQCAFLVRHSGSVAVLVENAEQTAKILPLRATSPSPRILAVEPSAVPSGSDADACLTLAALRELGKTWNTQHPGVLDEKADAITTDDWFTLVYTSGTTGQPKGVPLSHANLVSSCESAVRAFHLQPTDAQYLFLPLAHVFGREMEWAPIIIGSEVSFAESLARIKYDLTEVRPTFMGGVPRIFEKLHAAVQAGAEQGGPARRALVHWAFQVAARYSLAVRNKQPVPAVLYAEHALADKLVLSRLRKRLGLDRCRFLISGGAPLSSEIAEFFHGIGLLILEGYGLSETTAAVFVNRWNNYRFGTVGPAIDVVEHKIADDGEILLKGTSIFSGYLDNPAATAKAIDGEGWFHTGDIGVIEDGFLRIVDRKKDLIVTAGGKKVAPQKLENAIKARSPLVSQVVVFGDKRSYCVALVTPSEPAARQYGGGNLKKAADSSELRKAIEKTVAEVNATLASYETIKSFALLSADFAEATGELTPSLKVKRDVVASKFAAEIDALYAK